MKNIGIEVKNLPKEKCSDRNCPYHGYLKVRGRIFKGTVVSDKMGSAVTVEWGYLRKIPKLKRYMRRKSKVAAHNPPCIKAVKGDTVRIAECKPISKTKKFVVIEKIV